MKEFKLDNEPKITSGFKVDDAYFDEFQSKVMQRLPQNEEPVISLLSSRKKWFYAIAAMVVLALSVPIANYVNRPVSSSIEQALLENYLINNVQISDEDLVEVLNTQDLQQMKINMPIEDKELEDILTSNHDLEEYLIN